MRESHAQVDTLLHQLLALGGADLPRARELWEEVARTLDAHLEEEDRDLVPALLEATPRDGYVLLQEHRHIRARIVEIRGAFATGFPRESLRNFCDELNAHAKTEARLLYRSSDPPGAA